MKIPEDVLNNLLRPLKEIVPLKDSRDLIKCCGYIEKAYWQYLDHVCPQNKWMTEVSFEEFAAQTFNYVPFLRRYLSDLKRTLRNFALHKKSIPTCGAVLLSPDCTKVLLLQTYLSKGLWGFPKGKLESNETSLQCAIREVYEETSVNIENLINPEWYIEGKWSNSSETGYTTLYVVPNVSTETKLVARTNGEIEGFKWIPLNDLFKAQRGTDGFNCFKVTSNTFDMTKHLRRFLEDKTNKTQYNTNFRDQRSL